MDNVRMRFCKKIYEEYVQFRANMLKRSKKDILSEAYKIDVFANLYEILVEKSETLSDEILKNLINISGLLDILYDCWLKKADGWFDELLKHVEDELDKAMEA